MNLQEIQRLLTVNGFDTGNTTGVRNPGTTAAVKRFQLAYAGPGAPLDIDGIPGPLTQKALGYLPLLSPHFEVSEFWCKHCHQSGVRRELLLSLEALRAVRGRAIFISSGYRCPIHNKNIGGATKSMHIFGAACDIDVRRTLISVNQVRAIQRFSGIGTRGSSAGHLDIRHLMGANNLTPAATPTNPEIWSYY